VANIGNLNKIGGRTGQKSMGFPYGLSTSSKRLYSRAKSVMLRFP